MSDDPTGGGHPSTRNLPPTTNAPPSPADAGPFSATYPADADLPFGVVHYGPDAGTEADYRLLGELEGKRVLNLGVGGGHAAVTMATQGAHVVAVDPSADRISRTREAADRQEVKIELHQGDFAEIAFVRAESIDVVFSAYGLATVGDLSRVFRQAHRVLRTDLPIVFSVPHPAFAMIDPASNDPMRVRRSYWDETPRAWGSGSRSGEDHPHTMTSIFTNLSRANFRVDTLLEPQPIDAGSHSAYWSEIMRWVPATLVVRARKVGT